MGYKRGPMWGSTCQANISVAKQLARVDLPEPRDVTAYLYGWASPDGSNNTAGFYDISIGSGGTSTRLERVTVPAPGRVLHFVTANLIVDATPPGFPVPPNTMAKAHIGLGRPTTLITQNATSGTFPIPLPPFVVEAKIVAAFAFGPGGLPPPADTVIQVAQANDPLFAFPSNFPLANLQDGVIPIEQSSGFWRLQSAAGATVRYQHTIIM